MQERNLPLEPPTSYWESEKKIVNEEIPEREVPKSNYDRASQEWEQFRRNI